MRRQMVSESTQKKHAPKQWSWGKQQVIPQQVQSVAAIMPLHNLHQSPKSGPFSSVTGVNGVNETYIVTSAGTPGGNLWSLNLSQMPGEQKRLITVLQGTTFLLNYASNHYPSRINLICNEITPTKSKEGNPCHIIGVLTPCGAPTVINNNGGVIGYNIAYTLLGSISPVQITTLPSLTFDVTIDQNGQIVADYPLAQALSLMIQVTRVIF